MQKKQNQVSGKQALTLFSSCCGERGDAVKAEPFA